MSRGKPDRRAEEILGSKGRVRVLRVLSESGELHISEVSRRTGLNYTTVESHLVKLQRLGLLREKRYSNIRVFETVFRSLRVVFERGLPVSMEIDE